MDTPQEAAKWMAEEVEEQGYLYQEYAVSQLPDDLVYENENGNPAISRGVLRLFRNLTEETVYWDRWERAWYWRDEGDDTPGHFRE